MARKVVFLDRDGTINVDRGYVHRIEDWEFIPGVIEAIRELRSCGFAVAVVSNQSAIAAGMYTLHDVMRLHSFVLTELVRFGTTLDAIAVCPHSSSDHCNCRKPRAGLSHVIEEQLGKPIDYSASWTIGDKESDIGFGLAVGTSTILLPSRYWQLGDLKCQPNSFADSLSQASQKITGKRGDGLQ